MKMVYYKLLLKTTDGLLQTIEHELINETQTTTTLGHQIPLPGGIEGAYGGTSDETSACGSGMSC